MESSMSSPELDRGATDRLGRPLRKLRLSVTDRCNLRCSYCMPEESYEWLAKDRLLRFEELSRLVDVFTGLGVEEVRLTGGEPLMRRDLDQLVALLARKEAVRDLAMTTNAVMLGASAETLRAAGLGRLTVSLDTLDRERYRTLMRRDELAHALEGIEAARAAGFTRTKVNTVVMRGVNDDEIVPLIEYGREHELEFRFIEYMDVGGATRWRMEDVVTQEEILATLAREYGGVTPVESDPRAPAQRYALPGGTVFGVIASTTRPFCGACDRARLTADGHWFLCLYAPDGTDLAGPLRAGATDEELAARILGRWSVRDDRGAEERLTVERRPVAREELRRDPRLEMHTRGG
jgi:cyclic pyranopterin phosphate synthase